MTRVTLPTGTSRELYVDLEGVEWFFKVTVDRDAAVMVADERMREQPGLLLEAVRHLVRAPRERADLAEKLHAEVKLDAAEKLAEMVLEVGQERGAGRAVRVGNGGGAGAK